MKKEKVKKIAHVIIILIMIGIFLFMANDFWTSHFNLRIRIIGIIWLVAVYILIYYELIYKLVYKGIYKLPDDFREVMYQFAWKLFLISAIYIALEILIGGRYFN